MSTTAARPPALRPGLVLGTAGHVDHGKSTLIQALTGTDPDRLAEEKARGLTIDLGFAAMKLASGRTVSFVDVPGHVRFIKNMLAGAGAVDACLFVVSAVEGWKPQSEEHLRILELLGLETGVVALTMADRVSREEQAAATAAVQDRLRTSFLAMAPVVPVGSVTGQGLDRLGDVLDKLVTRLPAARDRGRPRLWIDRAFPVAGAGAVVTGTLVDGSLHVGQNLDVVPGGRTVRVRGLQSHGAAYGSAGPGNRVAVNLSGAGHAELARGQALVVQDQWWPASSFDVRLRVLDGLGHGVGRRGAYRLHVGSADLPIRLRLLGATELAPGQEGPARLFLDTEVALLPGDRFVLRESGRAETVGGGTVLTVAPVRPAARARPDGTPAQVVEERGWVDTTTLERLTGVRAEPVVGPWVVSASELSRATSQLTEMLTTAGEAGLDTATLTDHQRALVPLLAEVEVVGGILRRAGARPAQEEHPWLEELRRHPFDPPAPHGIDRLRLRQWVQEGRVVECEGVYFAGAAVEAATRTLARLLANSPGGVTASEVRSALGTSRKFVLALLAHLDRTGVTRRRGDVRVAGPRLPTPG